MKIIAIIQARMGSARLPGKVLLKLEDKTVLQHVVDRVSCSRKITNLLVVTTNKKTDAKIIDLCKKNNINVFCGSENDVLDRYYQAAKKYGADHVLRITADCPLIDPAIIDKVIRVHLKSGADYTTNTLKETYPDGEDVEVMKFSALEEAWKNAKWSSEKEHVTPYIRKHSELFKIQNVESNINLGGKRWTLDNLEDFNFIKKIYEYLYKKDRNFNTKKVLKLLAHHSEFELINAHIERNEGYEKSLKEDKIAK